MLKFKFKSKYKLDSSKLCEFCIYRVFLTGTPLKVSVYIGNVAKKSDRIYFYTRLKKTLKRSQNRFDQEYQKLTTENMKLKQIVNSSTPLESPVSADDGESRYYLPLLWCFLFKIKANQTL